MSANETQVGGNHYKSPTQHWDLAAQLHLGYFEGQISKYLTRHRFKKGLEDIEKAIHFTKKLKELAILSDFRPQHKYGPIAFFTQYAEANKLLPSEMMCIMSACSWTMVQDLTMLVARIEKLRDECYGAPVPKAEATELDGDAFRNLAFVKAVQEGSIDSGEPGRGYVDQGRDI